MTDDSQKLAESIRSGAYFNEARAWYQAIYIGPISERSLFMIIAGLASLVAVMALIAMVGLLPIVTRAPVIVPVEAEVDTVIPKVTALRQGQQSVKAAILNFYLSEYVKARESYSAATWLASANLVHAQSDAATYAAYVTQRSPENPASLAATLGQNGVLEVILVRIRTAHDEANGGTATVEFDTQQPTAKPLVKTRWTAQLKYQYTEMAIAMATDEKTGAHTTTIQDPQFQVTGYVVEKNAEKN